MAFPLIPAGLSAGVLGLLLLSRKKISAALPPAPSPSPAPSPPNRGGARRPSNIPAGAGLATVKPNSAGGINTRTGPGTTFPLIAANDAFNGDTVAILEMGVTDQSNLPGEAARVWWKIMTPGNGVGYASAIDPAGVENFTITQQPGGGGQPQADNGPSGERPVFAGVGATPWHHRGRPSRRLPPGFARVINPSGTWLRSRPTIGQVGTVTVTPGEAVQVLQILPGPKTDRSSPGRGGWARVRSRAGQGWMLSEWLG